ncbi:class I adenylate-forming enzyme family protein [Streptomyces profundus]|uniref:class I adenylate-forming enzyme family protein n=1 Tax=Streptomyces profundus TaxID=2867410 RepID=UPI001D16F6F3|nr:class I adenylate-forming enzyme family protein [Streptomyces sp. MA3_2.13]UED85441.1 acyl--CoA ligase [Streptomyces sp. MA3_2.13]
MATADVSRFGIGALFAHYAEREQPTIFHLSRAFDIAPDGGTRYTVPQLADLIGETAAWLHAAGARQGDRIAIVKDNHWDCTLLACAAARIGVLPAMISGHLAADALETLLKRLDPAVLVTKRNILERGRAAETDLASLARRTISLDGEAPGAASLAEAIGERADGEPPVPRRDPSEPMVVTHTSGTTGVPKLVVHSAGTILGTLGKIESVRWPIVATRKSDTVASGIAFVHGRSIPWTAGTLLLEPRKAVVVADGDPATAERVFTEHPPTTCETLPAFFTRWEGLAAKENSVFRDVRLYVSTFDAMHPPTVRRFLAASRRRFPAWLQGWGQSEAGPLAFRLLTRRALARTGERHPTTRIAGRPLPYFTQLEVRDPETMRKVRAGERGVVFARTKGRCLTYLGEEERWSEKADGDWWNTGDVGTRGRTGAITLLDREVDTIPGISCIELEDVLTDRVPAIEEVVILGSPNQKPLPVVATADGKLPDDVWAKAVADLPELADPVYITWDEMLRTGTGKVRRGEMRKRYMDDAETFGTGRWT